MAVEQVCAHCGERLVEKGEEGSYQLACPVCLSGCDICCSRGQPSTSVFMRYGLSSTIGRPRPRYSMTSRHIKHLHFKRRKKMGYALEIKDYSPVGISLPGKWQYTVIKDCPFSRAREWEDYLSPAIQWDRILLSSA